MQKVYIETKNKDSKIYAIKDYATGAILHTYFTSAQEARKFIKDLNLNYEIMKGARIS